MKRNWILLMLLLVGVPTVVQAQDEEVTFTDEELTKYATVMKWADSEKSRMGKDVGKWVKENEALSGSKYKELSAASKKGTLEEAEASEEEMTAFKDIVGRTDAAKAEFKENYTAKIKEDIGAGLYNKLRKALKADADLKTRYEAVYASIEEVTDSADVADEQPEEKSEQN